MDGSDDEEEDSDEEEEESMTVNKAKSGGGRVKRSKKKQTSRKLWSKSVSLRPPHALYFPGSCPLLSRLESNYG